jgi:hypothetical protein
MAVWSLALPGYRSADETQHVSAALHLEYQRSWPGFQELPPDRGAFAAQTAYGFSLFDADPYRPLPASDALARDERPSFDDLGAGQTRRGVVTVGQHPPGYYVLLASAGTLLPAGTPADLQIWVLRMLSVALLAPLPVIVAAATRRLGGSPPAVITASILPLAVPQLAVVGGAVNNDNLLNAAAAWLALGVAVVATGDLRARTGVLLGLAAAVALLTKAFALTIVPVVGVAYLVAALRSGRWRAAATGATAYGATALLGGWWWVHNLVRYGELQPAGHMPARAEGPLSFSEGIGDYWERFVELMPGRFWAMLSIKGGGDAALPWLVPVVLSVALIGFLVVAVARRHTFGAGRTDVALLVAPFFVTMAVLVASTWRLYTSTGNPRGLQGRYLFVALPGVFVVAALVLGRIPLLRSRGTALPVAVAAGALGFLAVCLVRAVSYHWGATDSSLTDAPGALVAWAPVPWWLCALVAVGLLATVGILGAQLVGGLPGRGRHAGRRMRPPSQADSKASSWRRTLSSIRG